MMGVTTPCLNCVGKAPVMSDEFIIVVIGQTKTSIHFFTRTVGIGSSIHDFVLDDLMTDLTSSVVTEEKLLSSQLERVDCLS